MDGFRERNNRTHASFRSITFILIIRYSIVARQFMKFNQENKRIQTSIKGLFNATSMMYTLIHSPPVEAFGSTDGSIAILVTARLNSPVAVRTVTTRTTASSPG